MSALRLLVASALVALAALAAPAAAYVRSTSDTTGAPLFWPMPTVPFHVSNHQPYTPTPTCAPTGDRDPALDAVAAGYTAWRQGCSQLQFGYAGRIDEIRVGLDGTGENLVVFRQGFCSADPAAAADPCMTDPDVDCGGIYNCFEDQGAGDRNIVALTSVLYDPSSGRIFDADVEVNGWDGEAGTSLSSGPGGPAHGWYFTCDKQAGWGECAQYGDAGCYYIDLQNTVTHEVGHVLGLAHVCEQGTCAPDLQALTMYPATSPGDTGKRSLEPDDVAGVCAIYPVRRSSGGCASSGDAATLAAALLATAALLRRRRAS